MVREPKGRTCSVRWLVLVVWAAPGSPRSCLQVPESAQLVVRWSFIVSPSVAEQKEHWTWSQDLQIPILDPPLSSWVTSELPLCVSPSPHEGTEWDTAQQSSSSDCVLLITWPLQMPLQPVSMNEFMPLPLRSEERPVTPESLPWGLHWSSLPCG